MSDTVRTSEWLQNIYITVDLFEIKHCHPSFLALKLYLEEEYKMYLKRISMSRLIFLLVGVVAFTDLHN